MMADFTPDPRPVPPELEDDYHLAPADRWTAIGERLDEETAAKLKQMIEDGEA